MNHQQVRRFITLATICLIDFHRSTFHFNCYSNKIIRHTNTHARKHMRTHTLTPCDSTMLRLAYTESRPLTIRSSPLISLIQWFVAVAFIRSLNAHTYTPANPRAIQNRTHISHHGHAGQQKLTHCPRLVWRRLCPDFHLVRNTLLAGQRWQTGASQVPQSGYVQTTVTTHEIR